MNGATILKLENYSDSNGNVIRYAGPWVPHEVNVSFSGSGNRLIIEDDAALEKLHIAFKGSGAEVMVGGATSARCAINIGSESRVAIGRGLSTTSAVYMTAFERASINIGCDCMLAGNVQIRADDAHPIFDVSTGARTNIAKPISIGDHVWLGEGCVILGGSQIGSGSIVGMRSVVKLRAPNNCIIAGVPARVVRKDVAWERTHLSHEKLFDASGVPTRSRCDYWHMTHEE